MSGIDLDTLVSSGTVSASLADAIRLLHDLGGIDPGARPLATLAMVLALRVGEDGHSCLELADIESWGPSNAGWRIDSAAVRSELAESVPFVGLPTAGQDLNASPFMLDEDRLYVTRSWTQEQDVAAALVRDGASHLSVVLGGPGTGKTTRIANDLVARFSSAPESDISVALVAPTGRAARRMRQALESALVSEDSDRVPVPHEIVARILAATTPRTVHKLLGYSPRRTPHFARRPERPLEEDIVIVDEASMMSLSLMHHLLRALRDDAELWLVGDPDQLASVDAGTVLGDVARAAATSSVLKPRTTILTEQRRFPAESRINRLVEGVRDLAAGGSVDNVLSLLADVGPDLEWIDPVGDSERLTTLMSEVIENANRVATAAAMGDFAEALAHHGRVQILCAHRRGTLGVEGMNRIVRAGLTGERQSEFHPGRPVMVTRNDDVLGLANGDVGIVCMDGDRRVVAFPGVEDPRVIPVTVLAGVETVHALTIHKSQGSEYDHAVVVLPHGDSRILTRELFYTGISRPRKRLTVVATRDAVETALRRPVRRATGLARLL